MTNSEHRLLWDFAFSGEVTIGRPAREVWPYFFGDKKNWSGAEYTTVSGEPGQVGEVYVMNRPSHASHGSRMFYEAIKIEPHKEIVLKITCQDGEGAERQLLGYDWVSLRESEGQTLVILQQAFTKWVDAATDLKREAERQHAFLPGIIQSLRQWVEEGR